MKKQLVCMALSLTLVLLSAYAHAYTIRQGTLTIGGASTAFFSSNNYDQTNDYNKYEVDVKAGYFVKDNIEIGSSLFYEEYYSDTRDYKGTGISPFILFHSPLNENSNIFGGGGLIFSNYQYSYNSGNSRDRTSNSVGYFVKAGWEYFFNPNVAVDIEFKFSHVEWDLSGYSITKDKVDSFVGPKLGIKVFF